MIFIINNNKIFNTLHILKQFNRNFPFTVYNWFGSLNRFMIDKKKKKRNRNVKIFKKVI